MQARLEELYPKLLLQRGGAGGASLLPAPADPARRSISSLSSDTTALYPQLVRQSNGALVPALTAIPGSQHIADQVCDIELLAIPTLNNSLNFARNCVLQETALYPRLVKAGALPAGLPGAQLSVPVSLSAQLLQQQQLQAQQQLQQHQLQQQQQLAHQQQLQQQQMAQAQLMTQQYEETAAAAATVDPGNVYENIYVNQVPCIQLLHLIRIFLKIFG